MLLRAYTADNLYAELNMRLATGQFSGTKNYICAMAKGLELHGDEYRAKGVWKKCEDK